MKEYQIWGKGACFGLSKDEGGIVIPGKEIFQKVYSGDWTFYILADIPIEREDELNELLKLEEDVIDDYNSLSDFLEKHNIHCDIEYPEEYEIVRSVLCYDEYNKNFFDLDICESCATYQWWNGHNWKTEMAGEDVTVTVVMVEDEVCRDLDTWDGNNFNTGGQRFYHEQVYKVLELDDEKVEGMYLVYGYSQWQGTHATARVMTKDELENHIIELNEEE